RQRWAVDGDRGPGYRADDPRPVRRGDELDDLEVARGIEAERQRGAAGRDRPRARTDVVVDRCVAGPDDRRGACRSRSAEEEHEQKRERREVSSHTSVRGEGIRSERYRRLNTALV